MNVVINIDTPTPLAFENVYEDGDRWEKIQGCDSCPTDRRKRCCGNCPMMTGDAMCSWHVDGRKISAKPFYCVVLPTPNKCNPECRLVFKCTRGSAIGKIRHVSDRGGVLR